MKLQLLSTKILITIVALCAVVFFFLFVFFDISGILGKFSSSKEKELRKVNIAFQSWVGYGPLYLAQEKNFFRSEGIEVIFIDEELDSARRDAFKANMLDCEAGTIDLLVSKIAQNAPVVAVLELDFSFGGDAIVVTEDIKKLEDLIGRKVALTRDDVNQTFISYLFYEAKLPLDGLNFIYRSPEEVSRAFLNGEADAAVTWQPYLSEALNRKGAHILISSRDKPGIIVDTLNVRKDLIKNNPELVKGLMRSWFRAVKYYNEHPVEASEIIAPYYHIKPQDYRKSLEGFRWVSYSEQINPKNYEELIKVFNGINEIKFANKRIDKKLIADEAIDKVLLGELYENSQ